MDQLVIKTHDFEDAKLAIKRFSEQTSTELDLKRVDDRKGVGEWLGDAIFGGGIGLDHKVTGKELNELTVQVQTHLRSVNDTQIKLIKQFGQVYEALDALDKEYIQAILIAIKAAEKTNDGIAAAQERITKIVEDQKKTLEILKRFKQKLDGYAHLGDIDKIWSDCQAWHSANSALAASVTAIAEQSSENDATIKELICAKDAAASKIAEISNSLNEQIARIEAIIAFMDRLGAIIHLSDIDEMWDSLTTAQADIQRFCAEMVSAQTAIANNTEDIVRIQGFIDLLSQQQHLNDIDAMWDRTERHTGQIAALQEQDKTIKGIIDANKEAADKIISELQLSGEQLSTQIRSNQEAADQAFSALEEKNAELSGLVQRNKEAAEQEIANLQEQDAATTQLIEKNKLSVEQALAEANEQTATMMQQLNRKLMYAYMIAGGSLALAITELLIILLG